MSDKTKPTGAPPKPLAREAMEPERANFRALLLANPNHFGGAPESGRAAAAALSQNTAYEQLVCLGLHPEGERLQAVVHLKRHVGYGGGMCGPGTPEHVRFYVRRSTGWHDLGLRSFQSHDQPGDSALPLSFALDVEFDEARRHCTTENLVHVRAILSWDLEPPANQADWLPPWGNRLEARVQIAARQRFRIHELIDEKLLALDPALAPLVDTQAVLPLAPKPSALDYATLKQRYTRANVPPHRSGMLAARRLLAQPLSLASTVGAKELVTDIGAIQKALLATQGNTTFEELTCVGYNPETRLLNGVIALKRANGYSGGLCEAGSTEHVSFWVWQAGAWQSLGHAQVNVHDLTAISPERPVHYAVFRAANLPEAACQDVRGLRLRAILSWQTQVTDPDQVPVWGNVLDTHVQPVIGTATGGDARPRVMRINRVSLGSIDSAGFAGPSTVSGDCGGGDDSPFGGPLFIEGDLTLKSDAYFDPATGAVLPGQHPPGYQVWVGKVGAPKTQLTNAFDIAVFPVNPPATQPAVTVKQELQPSGVYLYREGLIQAVNPRTLARWQAGGLEEGAYDIEIRMFVWNGSAYVPLASPTAVVTQRVYLYNGFEHKELHADGTEFTAQSPRLTLGIDPPGGDCGTFPVGTPVSGTYKVEDRFFGSFHLALVPITVGGVPQPAPPVMPSTPQVYPAVGNNGTSGTWTLDTTDMTPCGYTVVLSASDRALVGDGCHGHSNQVAVGFCLQPKS